MSAALAALGGPAVDCRKAFKPGIVGVMSRSGGMTTEICNALSAAGLGESTALSIGGDPIIGSTYAELMPMFERDSDTKAVVIYSEPGGASEAELARWAKENKIRLPIVAFVAGRFMDEMPGMSFGHAAPSSRRNSIHQPIRSSGCGRPESPSPKRSVTFRIW